MSSIITPDQQKHADQIFLQMKFDDGEKNKVPTKDQGTLSLKSGLTAQKKFKYHGSITD